MKWTFIGELNKFNAAADNDARETERKRWDILLCTCLSHTCIEQSILSYSSYTRANSQFICMLAKNKTNDDEIFFRVNVCVLLYNCCCFCCFFRTFNGYTERALLHVSHFSRMKYIFCSSCNLRLVLSPICIALEYCIVAFIIMGLYTYIEYNDEHTMEWEIVNGPCHTL